MSILWALTYNMDPSRRTNYRPSVWKSIALFIRTTNIVLRRLYFAIRGKTSPTTPVCWFHIDSSAISYGAPEYEDDDIDESVNSLIRSVNFIDLNRIVDIERRIAVMMGNNVDLSLCNIQLFLLRVFYGLLVKTYSNLHPIVIIRALKFVTKCLRMIMVPA